MIGYLVIEDYIYGLNNNEIAVAADFSVLGDDAPETFIHDGRTYERKHLGLVPMSLASEVCSVRIYSLN